MTRWKALLGVLSLIVLSLVAPVRTADQILIGAGTAWRYNDGGTNLGTAWRAPTYNDAVWTSGTAQLGYGDGDEATVICRTAAARPTATSRTTSAARSPSPTPTVVRRAHAALRARRRRRDLPERRRGRALEHAHRDDQLHRRAPPRAIGGADESAWLRVAGRSGAAGRRHQRARGRSAPAVAVEHRCQLRSRAAGDRGHRAGAGGHLRRRPITSVVEQHRERHVRRGRRRRQRGLASATLFVGGPPHDGRLQRARRRSRTRRSRPIRQPPPTAPALSINVDGQTPHAHGLMKIPVARSAAAPDRSRAGAIDHVGDAAGELHQRRQHDAALPADPELGRGPGDLERARDRRGLGRRRAPTAPASNAGVAADRRLHGRPASASIDLTRFVQEWSNGVANHGIVMIDSGTDGIDFDSSESGTLAGADRDLQEQPAGRSRRRRCRGTQRERQLLDDAAARRRPTTGTCGSPTSPAGRSWAPSDFELTIDAAPLTRRRCLRRPTARPDVGASPSLQRAGQRSGRRGGSTSASSLREATAPEFTIIALPDTQHYSEAFPADLHLADAVDRQQQGGPQHRLRHARGGHRRAQQPGDGMGARQHEHEPARRRGALRHGPGQSRSADDALQPVLPVHAGIRDCRGTAGTIRT